MHPILTRHGSFFFYSYTAVMGLGLALAVGLAMVQARQQTAHGGQPSAVGRLLDSVIVALFAALLTGRAAFVAANWDYYTGNLDEIWLLWNGGISYHGAVGGGLLVLWVWSRPHGLSFSRLGSLLALPVALWTVFGWLACYLEGCLYGRQTFIGPLSADLPDTFGVFAVRYQTQLIGLALSLLILVLLWWIRRRLQPGAHFWLAVMLLSAARAVVDALRGDPMPVLMTLRLDLLLDAGLALFALGALIVIATRNGHQPTDLQNQPTT